MQGHGLELSIVRAIATAHGADLRVKALPTGGLSVEITFPGSTRVPSWERYADCVPFRGTELGDRLPHVGPAWGAFAHD